MKKSNLGISTLFNFITFSKSFIIFLVSLSWSFSLKGQYIISAYSSTGAENAPATQTSLGNPVKIANDNIGNIYLAETINQRIRKIDISTGQITTIAGTGNKGFSGDGRLATQAMLNNPTDLVIDNQNNIIFADNGNSRIRKIDAATGIITTIAGNGTSGYSGDSGDARQAQLGHITVMAIDNQDNLYLTDISNHRIRKIETVTGIITTIAGNGSFNYSGDGGLATDAGINYCAGLAIDTQGNVYLSSYDKFIRKIESATQIITRFAGTDSEDAGDGNPSNRVHFSRPEALHIDDNGNLLVTESIGRRIRKINLSTLVVQTIAGTHGYAPPPLNGLLATNIKLASPGDISIDASGNVYIADDNLLYRINSVDQKIYKTAGNGITGYSRGFNSNNLPISDTQLARPTGVALDSDGNVYIADNFNHRIRKVDATTNIATTIAGTGIAGFSGDDGLAINAQINEPYGIAIDSQDNVYFSDSKNHRIRKINMKTGAITTVVGSSSLYGFAGDGGLATKAKMDTPKGITLDADDNLYIADYGNHRIRKVDQVSQIIITVAGSNIINVGPTSSGDGNIATNAVLKWPTDIVVDAQKNLYIADYFQHRIRKVTYQNQIISTIAGTGKAGYSNDGELGINAQVRFPQGITVDDLGNIYFTDRVNHRIRKIHWATGKISTVIGNGELGHSGNGEDALQAKITMPLGITHDKKGVIYFSEEFVSSIRKASQKQEIGVLQDNSYLESGSHVNFSNTTYKTPKTLTFTIKNEGFQVLSITSIQVNGDFQLIENPVSNIASQGNTTFTIAMDVTSGVGPKSGTLTIRSNDADETTYTINLSGTVEKAIQIITFDQFGDQYLVDGSYQFIATGGESGNPIIFSATNSLRATISGNIATFIGLGSVAITANQAGNENYKPAREVTRYLRIYRKPQSIDFGDIPQKTVGDSPFTLEASTSSKLSIFYTSSNESVATVSGNQVTIVGAGITKITAKQIGNFYYEPAIEVEKTLTISKATQNITFNSLSEKNFGDASFNLAATSSSGLPITYTSSNESVATVSGNQVTIVGAGITKITASQSGSNNYEAATDIQQELAVKKAELIVTADNQKRYINNDNPVFTFTYDGFVNGDTQVVIITEPRASTLANQNSSEGDYPIVLSGGNATNYNFNYVPGTLTILSKIQLLVVANPQKKVYGEANPTLTFSMTGFVDGDDIAVLDVMPVISTLANQASDVGTYKIKIEGGQDDKYAFQYTYSTLTIEKAPQNLTFNIGQDSVKFLGSPSFILQATGGLSNNPVTFTSSNNNVASISGNQVTLKGVGIIAIYATQAGNQNYLAALDVAQLLVVKDSTQLPTTLPQILSKGTLSLYPNPAIQGKRIFLKVTGLFSHTKVKLSILNNQGQIVQVLEKYLKNGQLEVPVTSLVSGSYLLKIQIGREILLRRIIIL